MKYSAYPAYKDSGVAWLGEVPEHWPIASLNFRYDVQLGKMLDEKRIVGTFLAPYLRNVDVQWDAINSANLPAMDFGVDDRQKFRLLPGDLLVCEGGEVGRCAIWKGDIEECYYQKALHRLRPRNAVTDHPRFLYYLLSMASLQGRFSVGSNTSTIEHLPAEKLRKYRFPFPASNEQAAIVAFLDRETATIATLIAKQERLIALLGEKRQALIAHAVTKGLHPDVPMKDSGVPWLGEIPAHWATTAIKWLSSVFRGASPRPIDDPKYFDDEGEYAWVRIADVTASDGTLRETTQRLSTLGSSLSVKLEPGNLFISIAGTVGKPCIAAIKACIHDGFVYFPSLRINPLFLYYIFIAGEAYKGLGKLGTQLNLNTDTVGSIVIGVPPDDEIAKIVQYVQLQTTKIDTLIAKAQQAIALLREHRTSLIAAAVTGKIDVRGLMAVESEDQEAASEERVLAGVVG